MAFTHLHLHTEYSLLDGAIRLRDLPGRLRELGMDACAITDHGVLYGVIDFYNACLKEGIKPIIGCEMYVAPRSHTDKETGLDKEPSHLILLAENEQGYKNLMKLDSIAFLDGFYYRPRVDHELLRKYSDGLIALSACLSGEIPRAILNRDLEGARQLALEYDAIFGRGNFYLELQENGIPEQNLVNSSLIQLSRETGIPLVATNDCHYLKAEDAPAHEILMCMQTGKRMSDEERMRLPTQNFYLRSPAEMAEAFAAVPEAIANTGRIAERCNVVFDFTKTHLPDFDVPDGRDHLEYMRELCLEGLADRLQLPTPIPEEEYRRRLESELEVIDSMGFVNYYLIVWDFIRFARSQGIMVGPGRGSGAGSLAAYCLKITNIDPLKYGLIFERFLNVERVSMPDFDIDFCYERRGEVIDYVTEKYGADHVAQVITFGTLAARAVIRDVARALDVSYAETDRIAKLVPYALGITIEKALETSPELKHEYDNNPVAHEVLDTAMRFEGMPRHASTHAAGVIIASQPITELAPLSRNDEQIVVQFDKNNVELIGLLKFDFLGLRTLTVLRDTAAMVKENTGEIIDYDRIPLDDASVYKMIADGETDAVFQLESGGMTAFMKELRPESFEDIIAGISLFRPGPMEQIPRYVAGKHNPSTIHYDHPMLEPILQVTYGCMVYQEQVMQIVRELAGFSLGQADNIRRAMSKKKPAEIAKYKSLFLHGGDDEKGRQVPGAVARGVSLATAEKVFEEVMAFAGYAFNKSHAAAYAMVAYQTAWLKKHYPVEFMAAMLNSYMGDLGRAAHYVRTARKMGISVLPPDINCSSEKFTTESGKIRFSLLAVKNVGEGAVQALIREREENGPYRTYGDFLRRIPEGEINRKMIESLIRAAAFDSFEIPRSRLIAALDPFLNQLANSRKQSMEGQLSLFADFGSLLEDTLAEPTPAGGFACERTMVDMLSGEPNYPQIADFCRDDYLAMEKEMLGLYVSGHPLDEYEDAMRSTVTMDSTAFAAFSGADEEEATAAQLLLKDRSPVRVAGLIESRKNKTTRNNEMMSFVTLEDLYNTYEVIVFPRVFQASTDILIDGAVVLIDGLLSIREDEAPKVIANDIRLLDKDPAKNPPLPANSVNKANSNSNGRNGRSYGNGSGNGKSGSNGFSNNSNGSNSNGSDRNGGNSSRDQTHVNHGLSPEASASGNGSRLPVLAIRFAGREGDEAWERLLALISYFHGDSPVCVYFSDGSVKDLDPRWRVEISDEVMTIFARFYGQNNLALI